MILQIGAIFEGLFTNVVGPLISQLAPVGLEFGKQFLNRELNRSAVRDQKNQLKAQAIAALNTPTISVATLGGTTQPVGGRVQRSTFTPAPFTPAQSPIGNVPLPTIPISPAFRTTRTAATFPFNPLSFQGPVQSMVRAVSNGTRSNGEERIGPRIMNGAIAGARGEPRFAMDQFGRVIKFVPSPRPGEGFLPLEQARQLGLKPMKPFWRFNRLMGQFEKMKSRRMNPFNFKAASRAGRRIERTLDAVKTLVTISRKMEKGVSAGGKVVKFKTRKRKRA